ncbi:hypothetical protein [Euzebya sp.]|uniref:hypothetical protein n=1 Tax=Euzebya sp. TaxID=1971409 RepID=UPI0035150CDE
MSPHRTPTRRRVVGLYALLAVVLVAGVIGLGEILRHDHPAGGPVVPEVPAEFDPLRDEVVCEVPAGREGTERGSVAAAPELPVPVDSNALYDCPATWDGRRVRYVGEVVGAVLDRGDHAWVQLNDDVYADGIGPLPTHRDFRGGNAGVGALLEPDAAAQITTVGGAETRGDLVQVVATFRRVDPDSGEVAILDVEALEVLRVGTPYTEPDSPARPVVALIAAAGALAVVIVEQRRRRA